MQPVKHYKELLKTARFSDNIYLGTRQRPPYNVITPYHRIKNWWHRDYTDGWDWSYTSPDKAGDGYLYQNCVNTAYKRMVAKMDDGSSFGATATAERKDTLSMITGTVIRISKAAVAVKNLQFSKAARLLGVQSYLEKTVKVRKRVWTGKRWRYRTFRKRVLVLPNGREVAKTLASGWLLFSYGVKPLASDIYNGLSLLDRDFKESETITGRCTLRTSRFIKKNNAVGYTTEDRYCRVSVAQTVEYTVDNHRMYLAAKMGLTNPVQWLIEGIPFSFVLDWFSNLSEVVNTMTDFAGARILNAWTSIYAQQTEKKGEFSNRRPYQVTHDKEQRTFIRELGIKYPKFVFKWERFGWQRAANAISLLIGFLPRKST